MLQAVLGTDIAELLMRGHSGDFGFLASPNETQDQKSEVQGRSGASVVDVF